MPVDKEKMKIKIMKDGPYLVQGNIPLYKQKLVSDAAGHTIKLKDMDEYPSQENYILCRCGSSENKPYCDGTHNKIDFDGTETASKKSYMEKADRFEADNLVLTDAYEFCDHSRFCLRAGGIRKLIENSKNPEIRKIAIKEATLCPSGRLVLWDKQTGLPFEKKYEPSIVMIHDPQKKCEGPIWVRGGIPIESADGSIYETRNRVTLCQCGKSENKPYCDGSHWMNADEKLRFKKKWGLD